MRSTSKYFLTAAVGVLGLAAAFYFGSSQNAVIEEVAQTVGQESHGIQQLPIVEMQKKPQAKLTFDEALQKIIKKNMPVKKDELTTALKTHVDEVSDIIASLQSADKANQSLLKGLLESKSHELDVVHEEINHQLDETSQKLSGDRLASLEMFREKVNSRFEKLNMLIATISKTEAGTEFINALNEAAQYVNTLRKPTIVPSFPQPTFQTPPDLDHETPEAAPPAYMRAPSDKVSLLNMSIDGWGMLGINTAMAAAPTAPDAEAARCNYNPEDLAASGPEIVFDSRITALAEKLEYNPLKIYEYVSNEIDYQEYWGSLKGATGTLVSGSGNATDQASLLSALLRVSKIPTRYVTGQIYFATANDRGRNWMGVKTDAAFYRVAPNAVSFNGGAYYGLNNHVWIQACVPYDNYRGSTSDKSGYHWIPLDPGFEQYDYVQDEVVPSSFSLNDFLYGAGGYMLKRTHKLPHEAFEEELSKYIGKPIREAGYTGTKRKVKHDILPSTLPYQVNIFQEWGNGITASETATIPAGHRHSLSITVKNSSGSVLHPTTRFDMPEVALKRITLRFDGATQAQVDATNCVATDVTPVIAVEGLDESVSGKSSVDLCSTDNILEMVIHYGTDPNITSNKVNSVIYENIGAHNYHALQGYALQASELLIEERSAKILNSVGQIEVPNDSQDETLGEYLHVVGLKYMDYITRANVRVGALYDGYGVLGRHLGLTSTRKSVDYLFDLHYGVTGNGFLIDVAGGVGGVRDYTTGNFIYDAFLLSGYTGSAYESYIWQEMGHLDAVSSVRGIQFANETGMQVKTLLPADAGNKPWGLTTYSSDSVYGYSSKTLTDIQVDLSNGGDAVLPEKKILYNNWLGQVFITAVENGNDGRTGATFAIGGDYFAGGGYTTGYPVSSTYNPVLNTGFTNTYSSNISNMLMRDSGATGINSISYSDGPSNTITGSAPNYVTMTGDPVNLVSGNMYHPEQDFQLKGRGGLNIAFERVYNSHVRKDGPLGYGWTHSFNHQLKFLDTDENNTTDQVVWVNGNGATNSFDVSGTSSGVTTNQTFTNQEGMYVTAKRESNGEYSIKEKNGLTFYFENISGTPDATAKLTQVIDKNGNALNFAYSGDNLQSVTDELNRSLTFHYDDGNAHITRIEDWSGRTYTYDYDTNNNLISYETPLAAAGQEAPAIYAYYVAGDGSNLDHAMKSFTNPNGDGMTFEYYTNGKVFRHIDKLGQSYTFRYNKFRRETTTIDEKGIRQTYLFNEWGQQLEHVQGDGSKRYYEYTDANHPMNETAVRHSLGYETQHQYDTDGDLNKSTLPDGTTLEYFGKNVFHQYCTVKDTNGNYSLSRYDASGNRTASIALKKGVTLTTAEANDCNYVPPTASIQAWNINTYDTYGNLKTSKRVRDFTTQTGPYVEYSYDSNKLNPTTVKRCGMQHDANDNLLSFCVEGTQTFDSLGRMTKGVSSNFYPTEVEYDENGRVARSTDGTGQWVEFSYDDNGNITNQHTLGLGSDGRIGLLSRDTVEYDLLNRPIASKNITGFTTRTEYDEIGNVTKVTNPDGYSIRFEYDGMNRPTRAFDEHGHEVKTDYDIGGRPIKTTDPNGNSTHYEYYGKEENGRLKKVTTADNRTQQYFYDNSGNAIKTLDNSSRETLTDYDSLNRPVRSVGPLHNSFGLPSTRQVTVTEYNELGYVTTVKAGYTTDTTGAVGSDVLADQATYQYDDFGRQISETDANGKITQRFYDEHGNLKRTESPNGHIVSYTYDHSRNGLLSTQTAKLSGTDPSPDITSYDYNALGQITQVTTPEVTYTYGYDNANRLATITDSRGNKTLTYDYSPGGQLNYVADSDGKRTDFLYDAASRLTAMLAANGDRVNFIFDAGGRLRETSIPDGLKAQYSYDAGNNLTKLVNSTNQGIISQHDYTYDASGRRETHLENIAGTTTDYKYSYDNLDRVTRVEKDTGATLVEQYSYDQFNNRRTRQPNGGSTYFYKHDAAQQLDEIRIGSDTGTLATDFQYDDNGNLIYKIEGSITRTLTYDALERLVQVEGSNISTETYTYDHQGRRIEKNVAGTVNRYTYSGISIWAEFGDSWGSALAHYNYTGVDEAIIRSTPNAADTRYYHNDGLGSAVAVSDAAGATQGSARYDSWGNVIAGGGVPQFGFTGREPDATGLMYFRARYYDPSMGRFTQRDPMGFGGGLNPYAYVGNSPTNFTDPLGLTQQAVTANVNLNSSFAGASAPTVNINYGALEAQIFNSDNWLADNEYSECGGRAGMCHKTSFNTALPRVDNSDLRFTRGLQAGVRLGLTKLLGVKLDADLGSLETSLATGKEYANQNFTVGGDLLGFSFAVDASRSAEVANFRYGKDSVNQILSDQEFDFKPKFSTPWNTSSSEFWDVDIGVGAGLVGLKAKLDFN